MGVDIYGRAPRSQAGEYFRRNWGGWHPLVELSFRVAPDICAQCKHWDSNDGDGLDDADAIVLADSLEKEIERKADWLMYEDAMSGQESAADRKKLLKLRTPVGRLLADVVPDLIPDGKPWLIDSTREFIGFLRDCGGFEIW
jgi:hypothetical protein